MKTMFSAAAVFAMGIGALIGGGPGTGLPACATDETPTVGVCYWDAAKQGNGLGRSFIGFADGTLVYVGVGDGR